MATGVGVLIHVVVVICLQTWTFNLCMLNEVHTCEALGGSSGGGDGERRATMGMS